MSNLFLVTGGASGIGAACAWRMARHMPVVIADRNGQAAAAQATAISADGRKAFAVTLDVTDAAAVRDTVDCIEKDHGPITRLFSCAGINIRQRVDDITEENWSRMMATHVKGGFLVSQAVLRHMAPRRAGAIAFMSSDFAVMGMVNGAAYAAAKTALYTLTKTLALEFAPYGIRVNALGPGPIDTPLLRDRPESEWDAAVERFKQIVAMGRLGKPEEVAGVLDFLLSDRASHITGALIHPNGGQLEW
jgi:NAD(P)-dependent dehydrogenase (short-subunit alcohol dehydrogenase family)